MGMGHAAAYADVIEAKDVKKICPVAFDNFKQALKFDDCEIEEFAMESEGGNGEDFAPEAYEAFKAVVDAFYKETGLPLDIAHHQSDEYGDRYDEVNGTYFYVDGMYELTAAGKKLEGIVERKTFVQFG